MIKTKLFVQLPSVCTVIQYVYNYIHVHETFSSKGWFSYTPWPPQSKLNDCLQCLFASP